MGGRSKRRIASKANLVDGRKILASKRQFTSELENLDNPTSEGGLSNSYILTTVIKTKRIRETFDYNELNSRQQYNRQQSLRRMAMESGLAKSDDGYFSLIRGCLPKAEQQLLKREEIGEENVLSDVEEEWMLSGLSSHDQNISRKYTTYSTEDKNFVLDSLIRCETKGEIAIGIKQLIGIYPKYTGLTVHKIESWRKVQRGELNKRGTKINTEFESDVWSRLVLCVLKENVDLTGKEPKFSFKAEVVVNVTYSYEIVRSAAEHTKATEKWYENKDIKRLQFSNR